MFNPLAKKIGDAMQAPARANAKKTQIVGKPVVQSAASNGPSKDPAMVAAAAAAKKRSDAYMASKAAENVVPKITRR